MTIAEEAARNPEGAGGKVARVLADALGAPRLLQSAFDAAPVGLIVVEAPSGRVVSGNKRAEEIFRTPILVGQSILPEAAADGAGEWISYHANGSRVAPAEYPLARVIAGEPRAELDIHHRRGDGSMAWIRLIAERIEDEEGGIAGGIVAVLDIDAERRVGDAARIADERLRIAQQVGGVGTFELVAGEGRMIVSREFCNLWGLPPRDEYPLAEVAALIHPEDAARLKTLDGRVPADGLGYFEYRVRRADTGEERWVARRGEAVEGPDGSTRYFGVAYDITERKTIETALRDREERLRAAMEGSGAGTFRWGIVDDSIEFDERLSRLFGFPAGAAPANLQDCADRIHPDDRAAFIAECEACVREGRDFDMEYRVVWPDGTERWLHDRGAIYDDGEGRPLYMTGACVDVTERTVTARRLRTVLESITDAFLAVDAEYNITLVNRACERFLRFDRSDVIGRNLFERFPEVRDTEVEQGFRQVMETREPMVYEMRSVRRSDRMIEMRLSPKEGGGVACNFSDITQRKDAERHRELLVGELNHRVKNTLSIVQATAQQTFRDSGVPREVQQAFEGRLAALAAAHDVLTRENWDNATLGELTRTALRPFGSEENGRFRITGPEVRLPPQTAVSFTMALHELATNAAKYGALAGADGRVTISWDSVETGEEARLHFVWTEEDGPTVVAPSRRGFGSRMIERALAAELGGSVRMDFDPSGLRCEIEAPMPGRSD